MPVRLKDGGPGAVVKAACLESRGSRVRTALSSKETESRLSREG